MATKKYPPYSVLMSVYIKEHPDWLQTSIDSMLNQTIKPSEFVLVKDGPITPELQDVIDHFAQDNPSLFRVIELKENVGLGPALKIGIEECHNEYIARMDSDDYSVPTRIERQLEIFSEHPNISLVGSNVCEFKDNPSHTISKVLLPERHEDIVTFAKRRCPFRHPSLLYKKTAVLKAGNYREYYLCEDYDLYTRMIQAEVKCYNIQEPLTYMRIDENFYRRRGGIIYLKSILRFKKEQMDTGFFSKIDFIKSVTPHIVVCLMPNVVRDWTYRKILRGSQK